MFSPSEAKQVEEEGMKYKDRGDPADWDFTAAALILDNAWHTLDLSLIIPPEAAEHPIHMRFKLTLAMAGGGLLMREPGNIAEINVLQQGLQGGDNPICAEGIVMSDANRQIEYKAIGWGPPEPDYILITVRGWWID